MRHVASFVVPALAVALTASAQAQDPARPVLLELQRDGQTVQEAERPGFLVVVGRGLHACPPSPDDPTRPAPCAHPGLVVTLGRTVVQVVAASPTQVQFAVPEDTPLGSTQVEVLLDGKRVGRLPVEVVVARPRKDGGLPPVAGPRDRLKLTRFDLLTDGAGSRFVVEGEAEQFPDGMTVAIGLRFDGRAVLEGQVALIEGGRFRASFGPYRRALPLGSWGVSALFELKQQPARRLRSWRLDPAEREDLDRVERVLEVTVGTPDEIAAQREAFEAHYRQVAAATGELLDGALLAYASACRALFRTPGTPGYDHEAHLAHVRQVGAARSDEELERVKADLRFALESGHLRADAYQAWGEEVFLPGWVGSWRRDDAQREATLVPIEPRAARLAQELHAIVLATFQDQTAALFRAATLEAPPSLVGTPEGVTLPAIEAHQRGRRVFERQRDELLQRVGAP